LESAHVLDLQAALGDDRLTRGGPVVKHTGYNFEHFQVSTDARKRAVLDMTVEAARGVDSPTRTLTMQPGIAFKPMTSMFVQLSPTIQRDEDAAQYVTTVPESTDVAFFGNRYVFAYIKTRTISLDTRVNWTFSPNLTLQLFVQPFIANGAYSSFREFEKPRALKKLVYGEDVGTIARTLASGGNGASYAVNPDGPGPTEPFLSRIRILLRDRCRGARYSGGSTATARRCTSCGRSSGRDFMRRGRSILRARRGRYFGIDR
jgi:acetolactate synthase regulatory subunit